MSTVLHAAILLAVPCLALVIAAGLPWLRTRPLALRLAPWAALPGLIVAITGWPMGPVDLPWLMVGTTLGLDGTRRLFLLFTSGLWLAAGLYAAAYHAHDPRRARMFGFFLYAMAGNLGLIVAADAVTFYLGFLGMSLAAYGLIVHAGTAEARRAGLVYIVLVVIGEALILPGLWIAASHAPSARFADMALGVRLSGDLAFWLLAIGLGIKAAMAPLHVWLPLAHPVAPTPASAVLSGALVKAGLLGWLMLLPVGSARPDLAAIFIGLGLAGAFGGALAGIVQARPKSVLAYSTVSQMGLVVAAFGIALSAPEAAPAALMAIAAYTLHHSLAKGALFLGVGCVEAADNASTRGRTLILLALPAAALAGLPLTSGSVAKTALKEAAYGLDRPWAAALDVALPLAAVGTTLVMARFLWLMTRAKAHPAERGLFLPWYLLLAAVAAVSFLPLAASPAIIAESFAPASLWSALWPAALGGALALIAMRRHWRTPRLREGDVLWPVVGLGRRLWNARPRHSGVRLAHAETLMRHGAIRVAARTGRGVMAGERALTRWPVMAGMVLATILVSVALLA